LSLPDTPLDIAPDDHHGRLSDPARLASLKTSDLMDSLPEETFDRVIRLASRLTGAPVGLFSLVDETRQFFKAQAGLPDDVAETRQTPLSHSLCQYVVSRDAPLVVSDAGQSPLLRDNGAVRDLKVSAYLGVPIHAPDGQAIGSLCAIDTSSRDWSEDQIDSMHSLAAMVESELALRHAAAARQLLLSEMNHRVKNLFTVVSAIVRISRRAHEDDADALAAEIEQRLQALSAAHGLIAPSVASDKLSAGSVTLDRLIETLTAPYQRLGLSLDFQGPQIDLGPRAAATLALVFHEMITNAAKYGALRDGGGRLAIGWRLGGNALQLNWSETSTDPDTAGGDAEISTDPSAPGFGSQLIDLLVAGPLEGQITGGGAASGLVRNFSLPLASLSR
jgi:two-component sensor histidine kinase